MKNLLPAAPAAFVLLLSLLVFIGSSNVATSTAQNKNANDGAREAQEPFLRNCTKCHGKDGRAKTFRGKLLSARNLTDPKWQETVTDERIFNSISNGKGSMPAWGKKFSEAEINALVKYVRDLKKET